MGNLESLWIWQETDLLGQLPWYRQVSANRMPAKFRIAQHIPVEVSLKEASEDTLWEMLEEKTTLFLELWDRIRRGISNLPTSPKPRPNLVDLCRELTQRMLSHCNFCQWNCEVDRRQGSKIGTCKLASESRVSSYFHHPGEELIYRGRQGSGTIFFTSCNMRCSFCIHPSTFILTQRGPVRISQLYDKAGIEIARNGGWSRSPQDLYAFSHEGRPVKVTQIFKHDYSGDLILIEPLYGPPIMTTPEHQIPVSKGPQEALVKMPAAHLSSEYWLAIPRPTFADNESDILDVANIISPLAAEFVYVTTAQHRLPVIEQAVALAHAGATSFQIADQLDYHPVYVRSLLSRVRRDGLPAVHRQNSVVIEDGKLRLKTEKRPGIPAQLKISEELAEFLGYYCAEGHITKKTKRPSSYEIVFSFGRHEKELVSRTAELFRKLFDIEPRIVERRTTITVESFKSSLALLLRDLCGSSAATKRVPEFLFQAPPHVVEAYLHAFSAGDGCLTGGYLSLSTVSETLATGLYGLYLRLGHLPSFNVYEPPQEKVIEKRRVKQSTLYYVKVRASRMKEGSWRTAKHVRYRFGDNDILVPIYRVSRIPYSGSVYNLEVDDDHHTYTANFIAIGNCQNGDISTDKDNGQVVSPRTLATMAWLLRMEGCHNINWVGGEVTIHLHTIVEAISLLDELGPTDQDLRAALPAKSDYFTRFRPNADNAFYQGRFNAPMLWNSNFFMSAPTMKILRVLTDIWLPDLKFGPGKCGMTLSKTPWYWETVTGNMKMIYEWGEEFTIRHLVMPNHVECCTRPVLEWIAEAMPDVPVNIMDQYHPDNFCEPHSPKYNRKYEELARRPTSQEILQAFRYAKELGLHFESLSYEKNTTGLRL
ncbi:MAG: hypothetical protein HY731_10615 [Candidatus Tectomicrobia bacterium]|nr:hypothetical protein [Candidatus Tectomicrobia bacterium]